MGTEPLRSTTALRTGEVALRAGVSIETLRFYEREGILPVPPREESGRRSYPPETVELIRFIKRAQAMGLSLGAIRDLLGLCARPKAGAARVRRVFEARLAEVDRELHDLRALKEALNELIGRCDGRGTVAACPIIKYLRGISE